MGKSFVLDAPANAALIAPVAPLEPERKTARQVDMDLAIRAPERSATGVGRPTMGLDGERAIKYLLSAGGRWGRPIISVAMLTRHSSAGRRSN